MARIRTKATKPWTWWVPLTLKDLLARECPWKHMQEEHTAEFAEPWLCRTCRNTGKTLWGYCHCDYGTLAQDADFDADDGWRLDDWGL